MTSKTIVASSWNNLKTVGALLLCSALLLISSCKPTQRTVEPVEPYYEDLSQYIASPELDSSRLPETPAPVVSAPEGLGTPAPAITGGDVTADLNHYVDTLASINAQNPYLQVYTVQVYTGNDREQAYKAKEAVYRLMPDAEPRISYDQPNYKVKVGVYRERLDAEKVYLKLHRSIPATIVIPERIRK